MIIDSYNTAQQFRGRSDYLSGGDPSKIKPFSVQRLFDAMDEAGINMAMVCSLGQHIENDFISELSEADPDRLFGFIQVMPQWEHAVSEIEKYGQLDSVKGLKLHPTLHGYHMVDHGLLDPVFQACEDAGISVLINALDDPFCAPLAIEEISRNFPSLPTIIAHMGAVWNTPEAMIVAERNENVFLETSSTLTSDVRKAYQRLGPEKLLLGTEWPGSDFQVERLKIAKAIPNRADRALVEGGNAATLFGLGDLA